MPPASNLTINDLDDVLFPLASLPHGTSFVAVGISMQMMNHVMLDCADIFVCILPITHTSSFSHHQ